MEIVVNRIFKGNKYTIGKLYVNGEYICDTLEDVDRGLTQSMSLAEIKKKKVYSQTAIPVGTYDVEVSKSPKFGRNLPRLQDVPGFTGILIHRGNTASDSAGCILVGENKVVGKVINSTKYELKLTQLIQAAQNNNESITINIK